jgi:hypothetical protein
MAYRQMRERVKIKKGEDKSGMVSSLFIHPVNPTLRDKSREDADSERKCLSEMASFQAPLFLTGFILSKGILLQLKFIFLKEEDVNCKITRLHRFLDSSRNLLTIS